MTTRADVKIHGEYDWIATIDPTSSEKAPAYAAGERWLNDVSGESFVLTDATSGTWTQIETALDAKITRVLAETYGRVLKECFPALMLQRQIALAESPGTITRTALYYLGTYTSLYALWTLSGSSIAVDDLDDIVGDLEDMEYEDEIYIYGSKRNDGRKTIASVDAAGLTFDQAIEGAEPDRFMVALIHVSAALDAIVGRMVWYDVTIRAQGLGTKSEKIGTYSYTKFDTVAGIDYPRDVVAGLDSFLNAGPIADAEYVQ